VLGDFSPAGSWSTSTSMCLLDQERDAPQPEATSRASLTLRRSVVTSSPTGDFSRVGVFRRAGGFGGEKSRIALAEPLVSPPVEYTHSLELGRALWAQAVKWSPQ